MLKKLINSILKKINGEPQVNESKVFYKNNSIQNVVINGNTITGNSVNGKINQKNSKCIKTKDQPIVKKELIMTFAEKLHLDHFKFIFIQDDSLEDYKITIEAPENLIPHILTKDGHISFDNINVQGDLNTYILIQGKAPNKIRLSVGAIITSSFITTKKLDITGSTSSQIDFNEITVDSLNIEISTSSELNIRSLNSLSDNCNLFVKSSTSSFIKIEELNNAKVSVELSTGATLHINNLINSKVKGKCSTSGKLFVNDLNLVDVETSTGGKVKRRGQNE